jgi:hypothetical protein
MPAQFKAAERCLLSILVEHDNDTQDDRAGIDELLAGVEALTSGWLVPLAVAIQFVHCDPANSFEEAGVPERSHRILRAHRMHPDVRINEPIFQADVRRLPIIDAAVIRDELTHALQEPAPSGLVTSFSQMWWTAVRALLPLDEEFELLTPTPAVALTEIIDRAIWCLGPRMTGFSAPPAWLRATNSHHSTKILLEVYWDLWRDYAPGRALLDAGIARVLARGGWEARQLHPPR